MLAENKKDSKRVIILGAGASCEMRYPLGYKLVEIIKRLETKIAKRDYYWPNYAIEVLKLEFNYAEAEEEISNFITIAEEVIRIINTISTTSIDTFASRLSEEFRNIIKSIIIAIIRQHEGNNLEKNSWYKHLVPLFFEPLEASDKTGDKKEKIKQKLKNIEIITFNYDVSLEKFLYEYLTKVYKLNGENSEEIYKEICEKITHIYGSVVSKDEIFTYCQYGYGRGLFEKECTEIYDYKHDSRFDLRDHERKPYSNLLCSAFEIWRDKKYCNIDLIREGKKNDEEIIKLFNEINFLYILGFGFDQSNVELMGLKNIISREDIDLKGCFITNCGINEKLQRVIYNIFTKPLGESGLGTKKYKIPIISNKSVIKALEEDFSLTENPTEMEEIQTNLSPYMAMKRF